MTKHLFLFFELLFIGACYSLSLHYCPIILPEVPLKDLQRLTRSSSQKMFGSEIGWSIGSPDEVVG